MIIVSQDKTMIINFNNVSAIAIDDDNTKKQIHVRCNNDDDVMIGEYATEERTKEVLQSIVASYQAEKMFESVDQIQKNQMAAKFSEVGTEPFKHEMPKE